MDHAGRVGQAGSLLLVLAAALAAAQSPSATFPPNPDERRVIETKLADLTARVNALAARKIDDDLLADVDVFRRAAANILRFPEEFATKDFIVNTVLVLDRGLQRAKELEAGAPSWPTRTGRVIRGYRSRVDGSVQPFGVTIPSSYDATKPVRLDIWQHGMNRTMNEVAFIVQQEADRPVPAGQDFIQLEPFGRSNVSYRWAGETDVFESLAATERHYTIDPHRIVLRGFSMGGAGSWHLGLHHPGRWAAIEAGAGYTETRRYAKRENLPPYQEALLHYYDAVDYSLNAFNTPTVGYGGEIDAQLQASVNIREQLEREGLRFQQDGPFRWITKDLRALFLVGPKTAHSWHPDSKAESNAFIAKALENAGREPDHVRFVTYTARFNKAHWVTVDGLEQTYKRAGVDATRRGSDYAITTTNVSGLTIDAPGGSFTIDGQSVRAAAKPSFAKGNGKWAVLRSGPALRKAHGLQGPIDDAFMDAFLCVRPTGTPWNALTKDRVAETLETFSTNFAKWLRGDVRVKDDGALSAADIADHNLILFGDPGSNRVLARILNQLPIRWTREQITIGGRSFTAADHIPALIYPNPLNSKRYVVINSGHTFGEADFRGTNALLYPRIGDYGVLSRSGEILMSGFFDESWRLPAAQESRRR